jgi:hypothetical protein
MLISSGLIEYLPLWVATLVFIILKIKQLQPSGVLSLRRFYDRGALYLLLFFIAWDVYKNFTGDAGYSLLSGFSQHQLVALLILIVAVPLLWLIATLVSFIIVFIASLFISIKH